MTMPRLPVIFSRFNRLSLLATVLCLPAICAAQEQCPWVNRATAEGAMGGEAVVSVDRVIAGQTRCAFRLSKAEERVELRIEVAPMKDWKAEFAPYKAECNGLSTSLRAIGNEAMMCRITGEKDIAGRRVIGRVRDRAFLVTLTAPAGSSVITQDQIASKIQMVAEQVAGNLF